MQQQNARSVGEGTGDARDRIISCAISEFLEKGFAGASLRSIAAAAHVTTGAIYGYFSGKEALFDAIVEPAGNELFARYMAAQKGFYALPVEDQSFARMQNFEAEIIHDLLDFVYDNHDSFVLIFSQSTGTPWEHYLDKFIDVEVESTFRYMREMRERGHAVNDVTLEMARILAGMFLQGYFEPLILGMPRDEAHRFITDLERFFHEGYELLLLGPSSKVRSDT